MNRVKQNACRPLHTYVLAFSLCRSFDEPVKRRQPTQPSSRSNLGTRGCRVNDARTGRVCTGRTVHHLQSSRIDVPLYCSAHRPLARGTSSSTPGSSGNGGTGPSSSSSTPASSGNEYGASSSPWIASKQSSQSGYGKACMIILGQTVGRPESHRNTAVCGIDGNFHQCMYEGFKEPEHYFRPRPPLRDRHRAGLTDRINFVFGFAEVQAHDIVSLCFGFIAASIASKHASARSS